MRLLATLGATPAIHRHRYELEGALYETALSFEAVKLHYGIDDRDVTIVGTRQTRETLHEEIAPYRFVEVDPNDLDDIFHKTLEAIDGEIVVDLTQSFRSVPFGALLALSFSKSLGKYAREIFYAQPLSNACNPSRESCDFRFVSLLRYDRIADAARTINTFVATLLVLDRVDLADRELRRLRSRLEALSRSIYDNNADRAITQADALREKVAELIGDEAYDYLGGHLRKLTEELDAISACGGRYESEKLLCMSAYLLSKEITLHAMTMLYESMLAFLDEELDVEECTHYTDRRGKRREASIYRRRNCLKKGLGDCRRIRQIPDCDAFVRQLGRIDRLRNISAHGYTSDNTSVDLTKTIEETIGFLRKLYPKRRSAKEGIDRLLDAFGDR
ncbi:TM1812 family CRISPR-associated protein [Nitratifractor sp.]